jgi:ABC-type phosphate transport system permease subunit
MHLFTITTQVTDAPKALPYATAVVLLGTVLIVNTVAIFFRVRLRNRKRW